MTPASVTEKPKTRSVRVTIQGDGAAYSLPIFLTIDEVRDMFTGAIVAQYPGSNPNWRERKKRERKPKGEAVSE